MAESSDLFDWDDDNVDRRKVSFPAYNVRRERRWGFLAQTFAGRLLAIVYTIRAGAIRPITAWDADDREKRRYRRARR